MAKTKVTELTALTTLGSDDLAMIVDDPGGTPASKKMTGANLATSVRTLNAATMTGTDAATVANVNVIGGVPLVHRILLASGANADVDVALTHKSRFIGVKVVLKGAGTAGSVVTVKNVTTAITNAIDVSGGADKAVFNEGTIDDAQHEIAAAANLRVTYASTGGDFPGAEVYVTVLRVA